MTINGIELEFNIYDYETATRYEEAMKILGEEVKAESLSGSILRQCEIGRRAIDHIFGDGTSDMLFGHKYDLMDVTNAIRAVIEAVGAQKDQFEALTAKYAPNRAARRAGK